MVYAQEQWGWLARSHGTLQVAMHCVDKGVLLSLVSVVSWCTPYDIVQALAWQANCRVFCVFFLHILHRTSRLAHVSIARSTQPAEDDANSK